ncbi:hypothetical protein BYT27DRAFT_6954218 [Phlegmacium glaucopus]|nr:hypothetical protein BYT27DRAFT_6954218 [Phlegmacium glaucopus]
MFFENSQNTTVVDSQFTAVQGDLHIHNNPQHNSSISDKQKKALAILHPHISEGALYDSAARYDQPKCLPGTRTAILNKIMGWLHGAEAEDVLMWLYGPAGTGKTTILQTIAKLSLEAQFLVACFFFGRDYLDRNNKTRLIPTLVYQLATSIPEMCHYLLESLQTDLAIFGRDLRTQVTRLILNPLKKVAEVSIASLATRPIVIIVDGLDECSGLKDQQTIIDVLSTAARELIPHLLIIIASRPEPPIRKAFNKQPISILSVALDNAYSSQKDIESYFRFRFLELRRDPATALPDTWPSADVIRRLVEKASGQFIFASTVMNYLESSQRHPIESLEIVLGLLRSGDDIPFAELDTLYIHIFSSIPTSILPKVLDIFRFLLLSEDSEQKNTKILDPLFEFKPGEAAYALSNLHAILSVYPKLDRSFEIKLLHKSLEDFLLDKSRSGQFYIDPSLGHSMLATRWICRYKKDNNWNSAREAINHYIRGELTQDLIRGLQTFNISQHFPNILKRERTGAENYWTESRLNKNAFTSFYECIKGQSCPESSEQQQIYRHFLSQFDDWILSIIERCSDEVQECYGVFIKLNTRRSYFPCSTNSFQTKLDLKSTLLMNLNLLALLQNGPVINLCQSYGMTLNKFIDTLITACDF